MIMKKILKHNGNLLMQFNGLGFASLKLKIEDKTMIIDIFLIKLILFYQIVIT